MSAEGAERAGEGWRLGDDDIAGREERSADEVDGVGAAIGEQEVVGGHRDVTVAGVAVRQRLTQWLVADAAAVAKRAVVWHVERSSHGGEQFGAGECVGIGNTAAETNRRDRRLDSRRHAPVGSRTSRQVLYGVAGERFDVVLSPETSQLVDDGVGNRFDRHSGVPHYRLGIDETISGMSQCLQMLGVIETS